MKRFSTTYPGCPEFERGCMSKAYLYVLPPHLKQCEGCANSEKVIEDIIKCNRPNPAHNGDALKPCAYYITQEEYDKEVKEDW